MAIVVLAEKPSVAKDIARVIGATNKNNGYMEGGGYQVTWAFGHLVSLAQPDEYNDKYATWDISDLPIIPEEFIYKATDDASARKQLNIIHSLFKNATEIVCATDAGREGEAIFRYIYNNIGCVKPFKRLWISSLTDSAISDGFAHLKTGATYDNLYYSAKARGEADWLVGLNATRSLTIVSGSKKPLSLGRVQTPTLSLICSRYMQHSEFTPTQYFYIEVILFASNKVFTSKFPSVRFDNKTAAEVFINKIGEQVTVCEKIRAIKKEKAPLPFDITSLQAEANRKFHLSAQKTLDIVQALYEGKLLTYPRTGSRYLGNDMVDEIRQHITLLQPLHITPSFDDCMDFLSKNDDINLACFDSNKLTDHHAIIPTFQNIEKVSSLNDVEKKIYFLVCKQLVMALMPQCEKDTLSYKFSFSQSEDRLEAHGYKIINAGWRTMQDADDSTNNNEEEESNQSLPDIEEGSMADVRDKHIKDAMTKKPTLLTEATLLKAMETAGRNLDDEEAAQAMKDCGLGTPATRASIIETLYKRAYVICEKNKLIPTALGLEVYALTKDAVIGNAAMTGEWEKKLNMIADGHYDKDNFIEAIKDFIRAEVVRLSKAGQTISKSAQVDDIKLKCPICGSNLMQSPKAFGCSQYKSGCKFVVWKTIGGKEFTLGNLKKLLENGKSDVIKGLTSKDGKKFDAAIAFDKENMRTKYVFEEKKPIGQCPICKCNIIEREKNFTCSGYNSGCEFVIWKTIAGKTLSSTIVENLLKNGKSSLIKGFKNKDGKSFDARLQLDKQTGKITFIFDK